MYIVVLKIRAYVPSTFPLLPDVLICYNILLFINMKQMNNPIYEMSVPEVHVGNLSSIVIDL